MQASSIIGSKRWRTRVVCAVAASLAVWLAMSGSVGAGETTDARIDFSVYPAAGGVVESHGLRLTYTLSEPVAGTTSVAHTRVIAGFQALFPATRAPSLFADGFEVSSP